MKKMNKMRSAIAMIELIFAIVIIAISIMTIPSMMNIAAQTTKKMTIDDDVMARLSSQLIDKFQARWGGEYILADANGTKLVPKISMLTNTLDLNCSRSSGPGLGFRINPDSLAECNLTQFPRVIPSTLGTGVNQADGNVSKGIEKINGGTETLSVISSTGERFDINATYSVRYVSSDVNISGNAANAIWKLGSSGNMAPDGSLGTTTATQTHLKRIVVRFWNNALGVDTTLTFYKSNKGGN